MSDRKEKNTKKVYYLGPKYSFHYFALEDFLDNYKSLYLDRLTPKPADSFDGLFNAVRGGDVGIVAIENTLGGQVFNNRIIVENEFKIIHKIDLKIDHCLLALRGVKYKDIDTILLHPQVKRQTSNFLKDQTWKEEIISSTSFGALKIEKEKLIKTATIGSEKLAKYYNLTVLKKGLSNELKNITTFWVISL